VAASQPASAADAGADHEPDFLAELLENNLTSLMAGGIALLALLGFGVYRARRPKVDSGETSFLESRLQPDSFFGASGGQRIDTRESASGASSSMDYSLSQLDAIGDVDPVAEADVYLAYGRDLQAEEILKEALRSTPQRMAIRTKLLEVYAKRRDTKGFAALATQLFALTNGTGEDWAMAQTLGHEIDPENPLYRAGGEPDALTSSEASSTSESEGGSTLQQEFAPSPATMARPSAASDDELMSLDASEAQPSLPGEVDFHLDLEEAAPALAPLAAPPFEPAMSTFDFDEIPPVAAPDSDDLGSVDVSEIGQIASAMPSSAVPLEFDLSDISLDLDEPATPAPAGERTPEVLIDDDMDMDLDMDDGDPLARKLELAEEFRLIGDVEGARDLLQEIALNAEGPMKLRAQALLADLD
jgi:pilus assembly protein FimV